MKYRESYARILFNHALDIIFLNGKMLITDLVKNTDYMYG